MVAAMKTQNLLILGGAAVAAYLIFFRKPSATDNAMAAKDSMPYTANTPYATTIVPPEGIAALNPLNWISNSPVGKTWNAITGNAYAPGAQATQANVDYLNKMAGALVVASTPVANGTYYTAGSGTNQIAALGVARAAIQGAQASGAATYGYSQMPTATTPGGYIVYTGSAASGTIGIAQSNVTSAGKIAPSAYSGSSMASLMTTGRV
jgi:hypothetical protein